MIVLIDNYDSFTYNLVQYLRVLGTAVQVFRNDAITLPEIERLDPAGIVISPGPGRPESAGISLPVIREFAGRKPILGVCLGHQSIAIAFGGKVVAAKRLMHGKTSRIRTDGKAIYQGIASPFTAMRYHSLAVQRRPARVPGDHRRGRRRRNNGHPPPATPGRGDSVSSRIDHDAGGKEGVAEFSEQHR